MAQETERGRHGTIVARGRMSDSCMAACIISLRFSLEFRCFFGLLTRRASRLANDDPDGRVRHHHVHRYRR
jgi:hypothetical protein